ncbi:hypothetical protein D3C76_965280 [compost metagenome]
MQQIVVGLKNIHMTVFVGFFQLINGEVRHPDGSNLPFIFQLLKFTYSFVLRCAFIREMNIVKINIIGLEAFQAVFHRLS